MNRCPITYEPIGKDATYSRNGLVLLSRNLEGLKQFPYSVDE